MFDTYLSVFVGVWRAKESEQWCVYRRLFFPSLPFACLAHRARCLRFVTLGLPSNYSQSFRERPPQEFEKVVVTRAWLLTRIDSGKGPRTETIQAGGSREPLEKSLEYVNGFTVVM